MAGIAQPPPASVLDLVARFERNLDALYGLTSDEIATVEGRSENQRYGELERSVVGPGEDPGQA